MLQKSFDINRYWVSGLISGLGSLFGGALGAASSLKGVREANKANMELAQYSYQTNLEQWHRENAYNSPTAQMARLKEAGLNPNLVYGNGNAITKAGSSPEMKAPHLESWSGSDFGVTNAVQSYLQGEAVAANTKKVVEESHNLSVSREFTRTQMEALYLDMANKQIKNARDKFELDQATELRDTVIASAKAGLNKINSDIALNQQRINESQENVRLIQQRTNLTRNEALVAEKRISHIASQIAVNESAVKLNDKRLKGIQLDNDFKDSTLDARVKQVKQGLTNLYIEARQKKWTVAETKARLEHYLKTNGYPADASVAGRAAKALAPGYVNADNYYQDLFDESPYQN